ncbi:hypothetical protein ACOSP7_022486 [Xanthoceras sorbifolium]
MGYNNYGLFCNNYWEHLMTMGLNRSNWMPRKTLISLPTPNLHPTNPTGPPPTASLNDQPTVPPSPPPSDDDDKGDCVDFLMDDDIEVVMALPAQKRRNTIQIEDFFELIITKTTSFSCLLLYSHGGGATQLCRPEKNSHFVLSGNPLFSALTGECRLG